MRKVGEEANAVGEGTRRLEEVFGFQECVLVDSYVPYDFEFGGVMEGVMAIADGFRKTHCVRDSVWFGV